MPKKSGQPKPTSAKKPKPASAAAKSPATKSKKTKVQHHLSADDEKKIEDFRDAADTWHDVGKPRSNYKKYSACGDIWPYMIELIDFGTVYHIARSLKRIDIIDSTKQVSSKKNTDSSIITRICTEALGTSAGTIEEKTLGKFEKSRKQINVIDIEITTPDICKNAIQSYLNACKILFSPKKTFKKQIYFGYDAGIGPLGKIFNKIFVYYRNVILKLPKQHTVPNDYIRNKFYIWLQQQVSGTPVLCMIKLPANRADSANDQAYPAELTIEEFPTTDADKNIWKSTSNLFTKDIYEIFYRKKLNYNNTSNKNCFEYVVRPKNYNYMLPAEKWEYVVSYGINENEYLTNGPSLSVLIGHFLYKSLVTNPDAIIAATTSPNSCKIGNMLTNKAIFTDFKDIITQQLLYLASFFTSSSSSSSAAAAASSSSSFFFPSSSSSSSAAAAASFSSSSAAAAAASSSSSSAAAASTRTTSFPLNEMKLSLPKKGKSAITINYTHLFNTDRTDEGDSKIEYLTDEKLRLIIEQLPSILGINNIHPSKYKNLLHSIHNLGCIPNYHKLLADVFQDIKRGGDADQVDQLASIKASKYADQDVFFTSEDRVCIADALYHGLTTLLISSSSSGNTLQLRNKHEIYSSYQTGGSELDSCECYENETISLIDVLHIITMKSYDFVLELNSLLQHNLLSRNQEESKENVQIAKKLENTVEYYAQVYNDICESIRSSRRKKIYIYHDGKPKDAELNDYFDTLLSYQINLNDTILKTNEPKSDQSDKYVWNKVHEMRDNMEQQITIINKLAEYQIMIRGGADDFGFLMNTEKQMKVNALNEVLRKPSRAAEPIGVERRRKSNNSNAVEVTSSMVVAASKAHRQHEMSAKPTMPALIPSNALTVVSPAPSNTSNVNDLEVVSPVAPVAHAIPFKHLFKKQLKTITQLRTKMRELQQHLQQNPRLVKQLTPLINSIKSQILLLQERSKLKGGTRKIHHKIHKKHKTRKHNNRNKRQTRKH